MLIFLQVMTVADLSHHLQTSLNQLQQKIRQTPGLAANVQNLLITECRNISQEYNEKQRALQRQFDTLTYEKNELTSQLEQAHGKIKDIDAQLSNAHADRNRTLQQRDSLRTRVEELMKQKQQQEKQWALADLERQTMINDQQTLIVQLKRKLADQDEQLNSKRALWLTQNPDPSPRRDAMKQLQDPFTSSPSTSSHAVPVGNIDHTESQAKKHISDTSSHIAIPTGPSNRSGPNPVRRGALPIPAARPQQAPQVPMLQNNFLSTRVSPSNRGNQPLARPIPASSFGNAPNSAPQYVATSALPSGSATSQPSMALVLHSPDDLSDEYRGDFNTIYGLVEGWTKSYANKPNLVNDQNISQKNNVLWEYMMNCTYPGRAQDSHSHVMLLLNDHNTRHWFVMRMCVTYCVQEIFEFEAFHGYCESTDRQLAEVKKGEKVRGRIICFSFYSCNILTWLHRPERRASSIFGRPEVSSYSSNR
jgi:hypothetical protein